MKARLPLRPEGRGFRRAKRMILTLIIQIFGGLIALIPLVVMVAVVVWAVDFSYTSSFRGDPQYKELPEAIWIIRGILAFVGMLFGVILGYLILAEILGAFASWGFIASAKTSLAGILQAWFLITVILVVYAILRGAGWLSFKMLLKRKPIRIKREKSESQSSEKDEKFIMLESGKIIVGILIAALLVTTWFGVQQPPTGFIQQWTNSAANATTNALGIHN